MRIQGMKPLKLISVIGILAFLAVFAWGIQKGGFWQQAQAIGALEWGKVTLFDLYFGFLLFGGFVFLVERSMVRAMLWVLPTLALGNIIPFVFLFFREEQVIKVFRRSE